MRLLLLVCLLLTLYVVTGTAADKSSHLQSLQLRDQMVPYPIQPPKIDYPEYTKPSVARQYSVMLINSQDSLATILSITPYEDSAKPAAPSGWLSLSDTFTEIPSGESRTLTVHLNQMGVVSTGPTVLYGRVVFRIALWSDTSEATLPIHFVVADTIVFPVWDTITTQCGIPLAVATNGNMGLHGHGGANLNFLQPSPECDTGDNSPGNADLYLADASPVVVRRTAPNNYAASWSVYGGDITSPNGFKLLYPSSSRGSFSADRWQGFNTGTFTTVDSLVKIERTVWAPIGPTNVDSCKFMIIRTKYWPFNNGTSVSGLAIGDAFDWDIPSDSGEIRNVAGTDPTRRLIYMRGFTSADTAISNHSCYPNQLRYAGAALLAMYTKNLVLETSLYAGYNAANDSFVYPAGCFIPEQLWANMQSTGYSNESRVTDMHSVLVYKNGASNVGYTLPANDTLTVWTAVAVVRPSGGTVAQGLDSLKKEIDKAFRWRNAFPIWDLFCSCCVGYKGNVNKGPDETPDLSDLSYMISYLTISPPPVLPCICEADLTGNRIVDLSDLSLLIAYLTTNPRPTLPICQ